MIDPTGCNNPDCRCKARKNDFFGMQAIAKEGLVYFENGVIIDPSKQLVIDWTLPIVTVSEMNTREHWHKKAVRHTQQKREVWAHWHNVKPDVKLPCVIKLTRIGRKLDYDNLVTSLKYVVDSICEQIIPGLPVGRADNDPRISVEYAQEKGKPKEKAVRIQIFC